MSSPIKEIAGFLAVTPICFLATVSDNEPHVRPFQYQFEQDGNLWFCTLKGKDVCKQLEEHPAFELCVVSKDTSWLRVCGQVVFEQNRAVKERILSEQALIKSIYRTADNPEFVTFYIEHGRHVIADFSGNPPRSGSF